MTRDGTSAWGRAALPSIMLGAAALDLISREVAVRLGVELRANAGVAFGLLRGRPGLATILSASVTLLLVAWILLSRAGPVRVRAALSVVAGGAAANLVQRLVHGAVMDWIPLPFSEAFIQGGLRFDVADVEIALGAVLAALAASYRQDA
ncbi:MAG: signal peptidase II [Synergistaceae bacterium]|nr:signal peptidase II [Synergistaceae bacterium]